LQKRKEFHVYRQLVIVDLLPREVKVM
jgi:hypothetical protein